MTSKIRRTALAAVAVAAAGFALTACGSSKPPATTFESGKFVVGQDIEAGTYTTGDVVGGKGWMTCDWQLEDENGMEFATSKRTPVNRLNLSDGDTINTAWCIWHKVPSAEEIKAKNEALHPAPPVAAPAPGMANSVTAPGTYTVGMDIPAGVWASEHFTSTADVEALTIDGIPARTYLPTDTDSGKLYVAFDATTTTTGGAGDGYQRADGSWDMSVILSDGQTVTVTATLTVPFALYKATS